MESREVSGRDLKISAETLAHKTLQRGVKKVTPKLKNAIEDNPGDMLRFIKGLAGQN